MNKKITDYQAGLKLLEEAHLLSQPFAMAHFKVHLQIFIHALKHQEYIEVLGQIPRIILAIPGSLLGMAPQGNVGTTKMGIFEVKK